MRQVTGIEYKLAQALMVLNIWKNGAIMYKSPAKAYRATKKMIGTFNLALDGNQLKKGYFHQGKYKWDMFNPGWPGKSFKNFYNTHLKEYEALNGDESSLRRILIAITKKCPLQCEHCSEWDTLNEKDILSVEEYYQHLDNFVSKGAAQLVYSGGEPLNRYKDLILLIKRYKKSCDQWIYTSGYGLTAERAVELAAAGLDGVAISLDHHEEEVHNRFRGNNKSYEWVRKAVKNCLQAGLMVSFNSCLTKEYVRLGGIHNIVELAAEWKVPIVNILEPRAVGHYANKDVELSISDKQLLETAVNVYNSEKYKTHPTVLFPAMLRKAMACGGGRSYLLLDYDGTLRPCPFCKTPISNPYEKQERCEVSSIAS